MVLNQRARGTTFPSTLSIVAGPTRAYPNSTIHDLIELRARETPHSTALLCGSERLDYAELDRRTNRLARYLLTKLGNDGGRIGIAVSRSSEMVVALLATLKAGFAYVPLDPTHPVARGRAMLEAARASALIIDGAAARDLAPSGTLVIDVVAECDDIARHDDTSPGIVVDVDAPAYVIFTSGTTGVPKGVEVAHRSLVNLVTTMAEEPGFAASDVLVAVTTIAFDMSVFEIYTTLAAGGTLVVATSDDVVDGNRLRELIDATGATMLQSTPATWRLLVEANFHARKGFRMLTGGERLPQALADRLLDDEGELWNVYGPTETTVYATRARIYRGEPITIGRPLANTTAYVLDDFRRPVDRGVRGELYIGGDALARGYFHAPEANARQFSSDPFYGGRMYRTGDAARVLPDGTIDVLGRLDDQVKLRGYRIELGEIETALMRDGRVSASAVVLREDCGPARLVGYLVPRASHPIDIATIEERLRAQLPSYMIPTAWVVLDALPLGTSGKVDRRALPAPAIAAARTPIVPLETVREKQLGSIWSAVLGVAEIGRDDDIFSLGADSIQIFAIVARANDLGFAVEARDIVRKRTIAKIACALDAPQSSPDDDLRAPVLFFHSDLFADGLYAHEIAANIDDRRIVPVAPHGIGARPILPTIDAMAQDYVGNLDSIAPVGPYRLIGFCAGALVAYEVARLLRARGERVEDVILINAAAPATPIVPLFDRAIRGIARNARLTPRFREIACYQIERFNRAMSAGPRAAIDYVALVVRSLVVRGAMPLPKPTGETFVRSRGDAVSELSFVHIGAALSHRPHPYDGHVTLVWSDEQGSVTGEPTQGWNRIAASVTTVRMRGGHVAPLHELVGDLSSILSRLLHAADP